MFAITRKSIFVGLVILLGSLQVQATTNLNSGPIKYHELVNPHSTFLPTYHQLSRRSFAFPQETNQLHSKYQPTSRTRLTINGFNRTFILSLKPNDKLIHPDMKERELLVYHGIVYLNDEYEGEDFIGIEKDWNDGVGWASIMVHPPSSPDLQPSYQGVFTHHDATYSLLPTDFYSMHHPEDSAIPHPSSRPSHLQSSNTVLFRSDNLVISESLHQHASHSGCGNSFEHELNPVIGSSPFKGIMGMTKKLVRRDGAEGFGCDMKKRVLYMGVAADCNFVTKYKTSDLAKKEIISQWNSVSTLYEKTFNIKIGIIKIEIPSDTCPASVNPDADWNRPCDKAYDMQKRLGDFSTWREKKGKDSTGLWHLVTDCPSGSQVGLAWVGTLCKSSASKRGGPQAGLDTGTGVSSATRETWKVIAHEIGHNFGASHDCVAANCPCTPPGCASCCPCDGGCDCKGQYLMNPESTTKGVDFSPCSMRAMCAVISASGACLTSSGTIPTYSESMCGNGIKEQGEECDCGGDDACKNNQCCDAKTCKLKDGAKCDDSSDGCCSKCQPKSAGTICRAKAGDCDLPETCSGTSGDCPEDTYITNGTPCTLSTASSVSGLTCANGQCTSRDYQCQSRSKGLSVELTKACDTFNGDPCKLTCQGTSVFQCVSLSGDFAEGTMCGINQYCQAGSCQGGNFFDSVATWIVNNKIYSSIIGIFLLSLILGCCCSCCSRRRQLKPAVRTNTSIPLSNTGNRGNVNNNVPPPYVDPTIYNGPVQGHAGTFNNFINRNGSLQSHYNGPPQDVNRNGSIRTQYNGPTDPFSNLQRQPSVASNLGHAPAGFVDPNNYNGPPSNHPLADQGHVGPNGPVPNATRPTY